MKREIEKYQRYKTLERILEAHTEAFENRPEMVEMKSSFSAALIQISALISKLTQPISTIYQQRMDVRIKFTERLRSMIAIGLHYAVMIDDKPMINLLTNYRSQSDRINAFKIYETGLHVSQLLTEHISAMEGLGLTPAELTAFTNELAAYNLSLQESNFQLNTRRTQHADLKAAMQACDALLKGRIDTFITHTMKIYPELYLEYMQARVKKRAKRKTGNISATAEISGTVTDAATGNPVANATISLIEQGQVLVTDEEGDYLFDELPAGNYTLSCHLAGYEVPESVKLIIADDESLVINFDLNPIEAANAAA